MYDNFFWTNRPQPNLPLLSLEEGDPNALHVLGCWAGNRENTYQWLDSIVTNQYTKQAGRLPFDVITINFYTMRYGSRNWVTNLPFSPGRPYATCPEAPKWGLKSQWNVIETWRNWNCPEKPIWVSEYGWDTSHNSAYWSPNYAYGIPDDGPLHQANYLLRGAAVLAGCGAEKSFIFMAGDTKNGGRQELDIWLPEIRLAIEYDGQGHFYPVNFGGCSNKTAEKIFEKTKRLDKMKNRKIKKRPNDIEYFIRFSYKDNIFDIESIKKKVTENNIPLGDKNE